MSKIPTFEEPQFKPKFGVDLVLIDADILRYEIGSVQLEHPFVKGAKIPAPTKFIHTLVRERIESIITQTRAKSFKLFLTGKNNFRFDIATRVPYKGNREDFEKPFHWKTVSDFLNDNYNVALCEGNEADDVMGEIQEYHVQLLRQGNKRALVTAIASRDKDLRTQEGWHYSWSCGENQPEKPLYYQPYIEAKRFFFKQMLTGDTTDNILGCGVKKEVMWGGKLMLRRKGVGSVAADKLLVDANTLQEMYEIVKNQYEKVFKDEDITIEAVMLENAKLLYIGQEKDKQFSWEWLGISV